MKLTILGSGSYQPELDRHSSSYLIETNPSTHSINSRQASLGQPEKLVFDFGRGALDQLMKVGVNYYDIDAIFISHFHPDHYNDLSAFLHIALAEPEKGKFRKKDMTIYLPEGGRNNYQNLLDAGNLSKFKPKYKVNIRELKDNEQIKTKNWLLTAYEVKHSSSQKCLSFRLEAKGKIFCYSGDSEDCQGLRKAVDIADLAVIEASHPAKLEPEGHLTAEGAVKIAKESGVKKLVLTHLSPYYLFGKFDPQHEAESIFGKNVSIAKDLMKILI